MLRNFFAKEEGITSVEVSLIIFWLILLGFSLFALLSGQAQSALEQMAQNTNCVVSCWR